MKRIGKRVYYDGRVQGVGFRWNTKQIAAGFEVTGQVRNLTDGRVELLVAGEAEEVDAFLQAIRESGLAGHIASVDESVIEDVPAWKGFQIT